MKRLKGAMFPNEIRLHGAALKANNGSNLFKGVSKVPTINSMGELVDAPKQEDNVIWVVAWGVFTAMQKQGRTDIAMFDNTAALRDPKTNFVVSQGGFIYG
jgi:hypothetical protein